MEKIMEEMTLILIAFLHIADRESASITAETQQLISGARTLLIQLFID